MNRDHAQGRRHLDLDALYGEGQAGDWFADEPGGAIWIWIPGAPEEAPVYRFPHREAMTNAGGKSCRWGYNGDPDRPTLSPSLHCIGVWHGFLEEGRLRSC